MFDATQRAWPRLFSCMGVEAISISSRPAPARISSGWPGFSPSACRSGLGTTMRPARSMTAFMARTMPRKWHSRNRTEGRSLPRPALALTGLARSAKGRRLTMEAEMTVWARPRWTRPREFVGRGYAVLLGLLLVAVMPTLGATAAPESFEVQLYVRDGYLAVDPDPARTVLGPDIAKAVHDTCPSLSPERVRSELITYLDGLLRKHGTVLEQRLRPHQPAELAALLESDKEAADLSHANETWQKMDARIIAWTGANPKWAKSHEGLLPVYKTVLTDQRLADGPLILLLANPDNLDEIRRWFMKGQLPFSLAAPITADYVRVRPNANLDAWTDVRKDLAETILADLECHLWYRDEIIAKFSDYLEMRGISVTDFRTERETDTLVPRVALKLPPKDRVGIAPQKPHFTAQGIAGLRVIMSPDPLLEGILIDVPSHDLATIRRVLYLVLPSDDYRQVVADVASHVCLFTSMPGAAPGSATMVYLRLRGPDVGLRMRKMYLTRRFLAERLQYLGALGFTATPTLFAETGKPPLKTAHLLIARSQPASEAAAAAPVGVPSPIRSCTDRRDDAAVAKKPDVPALRHDHGQDTVRPESFDDASSRKDSASRRQGPDPERPRQIRLGVEYEPTRPLRYTLGYSHSGLTGPDALSAQVGFQDEPSGDLQYSRDFVFFDVLDRRLQVSFRAFSDFTPDRRLPSGTFDERRTGGEAGATLDLWRDLNGHWAQLDVRASWRESRIQHDEEPASRTRLALLDLGLLYFKSWDGTAASRRLEVQPTLTLGNADEASGVFTRATVDARHHQFLGAFTQWESRLRAVTATGPIPDVERPSFGGADSVRGYRPDAGLARTVWALQNEVWFPMRLGLGLPEGIDTILRRSAAFAVFGDVGGLHESRDSFSGVKAGAGVGLRLVWQDSLTLRLDYAHALNDRTRTQRSGLFYFTVTTRPTF